MDESTAELGEAAGVELEEPGIFASKPVDGGSKDDEELVIEFFGLKCGERDEDWMVRGGTGKPVGFSGVVGGSAPLDDTTVGADDAADEFDGKSSPFTSNPLGGGGRTAPPATGSAMKLRITLITCSTRAVET